MNSNQIYFPHAVKEFLDKCKAEFEEKWNNPKHVSNVFSLIVFLFFFSVQDFLDKARKDFEEKWAKNQKVSYENIHSLRLSKQSFTRFQPLLYLNTAFLDRHFFRFPFFLKILELINCVRLKFVCFILNYCLRPLTDEFISSCKNVMGVGSKSCAAIFFYFFLWQKEMWKCHFFNYRFTK